MKSSLKEDSKILRGKFIKTQSGLLRHFKVSTGCPIKAFNPLKAELNPICHLLALLGGATIVVVSRLRVKQMHPYVDRAEKGQAR